MIASGETQIVLEFLSQTRVEITSHILLTCLIYDEAKMMFRNHNVVKTETRAGDPVVLCERLFGSYARVLIATLLARSIISEQHLPWSSNNLFLSSLAYSKILDIPSERSKSRKNSGSHIAGDLHPYPEEDG